MRHALIQVRHHHKHDFMYNYTHNHDHDPNLNIGSTKLHSLGDKIDSAMSIGQSMLILDSNNYLFTSNTADSNEIKPLAIPTSSHPTWAPKLLYRLDSTDSKKEKTLLKQTFEHVSTLGDVLSHGLLLNTP